MAPLLAAIIISNTNSYSSTGGNVVGSGGTVTNGQSYSSAYVENDVNGSDTTYDSSDGSTIVTNGGDGSATVHIETDNNGQVSSQTITKQIPSNGGIDIEGATSSGNGS